MMRRLVIALAGGLVLQAPAFGHELDEYLQAALISLEKDHLDVRLRLVPGAEVFPTVFASIDTNADGSLSDIEKQDYARRVVRDLTLSLGAHPLTAEIVSMDFPPVDVMKEGLGEIHIVLRTAVPKSHDARHTFIFENRHQRSIAAYLVNCLTPSDPSLRITAQHRSTDQSHYELDYEERAAASPAAAR